MYQLHYVRAYIQGTYVLILYMYVLILNLNTIALPKPFVYISLALRNCFFPGDVKCRDNGSCIHSNMICNGINDCLDGSDEADCGKV